jgi:hypothetical protein
MIHNQQIGTAGDRFGKTTAPKIAKAIGATMVRKGSNEATLNDRRIVIKCATPRTVSVSVSKKMLVRLDGILGAFQQPDGSFTLISLPASDYAAAMKPARSKGGRQEGPESSPSPFSYQKEPASEASPYEWPMATVK